MLVALSGRRALALVTVALLFGACSSSDGGAAASSIKLSVLDQTSLPSEPASLRLALFADHGWLGTQRLPALDAQGAVRVYSPVLEGTLRLLLRAHDKTGALLGEGFTQVTLDKGKEVAASISLASGAREDGDGDGIPDGVDNCPTLPNPEQRPCTPDGGAGDAGDAGPRDLGPLPDGVQACALSGSYTIDLEGTSDRNYYTFAEAFARLANCGVLGPVVFDVAGGTYTEAQGFTFPAVPGASPSSTVTFRASSQEAVSLVAVGTAPTLFVVSIAAGAHDLVLEGLEIDGAAAGNAIKAPGGGLLMMEPAGGQKRITLRKLYLHDLSGASWSGYLNSGALNLSVSTGKALEDIVVEGCRFERLVPNAAYSTLAAVLLARGLRARIRISGCTFYGITRMHAIQVRYEALEALEVHNNFFQLEGGPYGALAFTSAPELSGSSHFVHNTVLVDTATSYAVGGALGGGKLAVANNVFVSKATVATAVLNTLDVGSLDQPGHSCLENAQPGYAGGANSDVTGLVKLVGTDAASPDLHLQQGSVCLGKATALSFVKDDIDGDARGAAPDIGADELP